jgi:hypothetical protein
MRRRGTMERDFWILLVREQTPAPEEQYPFEGIVRGGPPLWSGVQPLLRESLSVGGERVLPVFTSEAKALAFAHHSREIAVPLRLSPEAIQKRVFGGSETGHCVVDPTPGDPGKAITVNGLYDV